MESFEAFAAKRCRLTVGPGSERELADGVKVKKGTTETDDL